MGLGSLVGDQVDQATQKLKDLDIEFEKLRRELEMVKAAGATGWVEGLERNLVENRKEAVHLMQQLPYDFQQDFVQDLQPNQLHLQP